MRRIPSVPTMRAIGSVRPGFLTSPPMKERSAHPSYVHMMAISAVPMREKLTPVLQAGVKWDVLGEGRYIHQDRSPVDPHVVEGTNRDHGRRRNPPYFHRRECNEAAEIL